MMAAAKLLEPQEAGCPARRPCRFRRDSAGSILRLKLRHLWDARCWYLTLPAATEPHIQSNETTPYPSRP